MSTNPPGNNSFSFGNNSNKQGHNPNNTTTATTPDPNAQFADLLRVLQQQQVQQQQTAQQEILHNITTSTESSSNHHQSLPALEPTPLAQLGLLQQQQQQEPSSSSLPLPSLPFANTTTHNSNAPTPQQQQPSVTPPRWITINNNNNMGAQTQASPFTLRQPTRARRRPSSSRRIVVARGMTERQQFLIFVKILLKYVQHNAQLRRTTKAVVAECTRRNRQGCPAYTPLPAAVQVRLRHTLGEAHWAAVSRSFEAYKVRQGIVTVPAVMTVTAISAV